MSHYIPLSFWLTGRQHTVFSRAVTQPLWFSSPYFFGSRKCQRGARLWRRHSIRFTALLVWWDLLIVLMQSKKPLRAPASCLPSPPWVWRWKSGLGSEKRKPEPPSQHMQSETLCLHLNGANLPLKSNHYQFLWGQDNWLRIWFALSKHDYGVA